MKRIGFVILLAIAATQCWSAEKIKSIKIEVENPGNMARPAADVVVAIPELRKVAPDFTAGAVRIITATANGSNETIELPSQVDDLDGDGKADELAFQIDLGPGQTRGVTVEYGEPDQIFRLRRDYPDRTSALFSAKYEGLGWESENIAFRLYFDPRNAIDIYAKRHRSLQLRMYAIPEYPYHEESPEGRDIFKVGDSIGIGAVAAWVDGKVVKAADVKERTWRIVSIGPVRAIVEVAYGGWDLGDKIVSVHSRITMWAGEHGFYNSVKVEPASAVTLVSGVTRAPGIPLEKFISSAPDSTACLATWGEQVLAPGATATKMVQGQNLGLALITANQKAEYVSDAANYLLKFAPENGVVTWYAMAAWDQEGRGTARAESYAGTVNTKEEFMSMVKRSRRSQWRSRRR